MAGLDYARYQAGTVGRRTLMGGRDFARCRPARHEGGR